MDRFQLPLASFVGDVLPFVGLAAGAGLIVGLAVVLLIDRRTESPRLVLFGAALCGAAIALFVLLLFVRGD